MAVKDVEKYEQVFWFADVPSDIGFYSVLKKQFESGEATPIWIEAKKPLRKKCPLPNQIVAPWVNPIDLENSSTSPKLAETRTELTELVRFKKKSEQEVKIFHLSEFPEVEPQWKLYLEMEWVPWAEEEQKSTTAQKVYSQLYDIYQEQLKQGEKYELIIGFGILSWAKNDKKRIRRHLITSNATISFDSKSGTIAVTLPEKSGPALALEQDMLDPEDRLSHELSKMIGQELEEIGTWLSEKLENDKCPLTSSEINEFCQIMNTLNPDILADLKIGFIATEELLTIDEFKNLISDENSSNNQIIQDSNVEPFKVTIDLEKVKEILREVSTHLTR